MTTNIIDVSLQLRRDNEDNYNRIKDLFIPLKGEVCLVDTKHYGLKIKIGDGSTVFSQLPYFESSSGENPIKLGYRFRGLFYTDTTYQIELEKDVNFIYIDKNSNNSLYTWNGSVYLPSVPQATDTVAGLVKLYQQGGYNTDGTMSQKVITEGVNSISFVVNEEDSECLEIDVPWD